MHLRASVSISHPPIILHPNERLSSPHFRASRGIKKGRIGVRPGALVTRIEGTIAVTVLTHCCHRMISFAAASYLPSTVAARGGYRPGFAAARSIPFAGVLSGRLAHGRAA